MQSYPLTVDKFMTHAAKWHPDAQVVTANSTGGIERMGYALLAERARRVSAGFARMGIGSGDRIATLAWNSRAHVEVWYAVMGMGAVCHTLNPRLAAEQLAAMVRQSEAQILVASANLVLLAQEIAAAASSIRQVLVIDGDEDEASPDALDELITSCGDEFEWGGFDENAPCGLCFTSGTTGAPKGVTYTHRSSFLHTLRLLQADVMSFTRHDSILAAVPMFHANAWGLPFAAPAVGAKLVLPGRQLDGASLAHLIRSEGVTVGVGVPTVWLGLVEHLEATGCEVRTLERVIMGGAPLPPALMARVEQRLGVRVQTSWGMTELSPSGTVASPHEVERSSTLSGRPAIGVDLLLTDAGGRPLPQQRGVEGHLRVRGAAVIERYFGQEAPAVDQNGWLVTGDLALIDADGNLILTGRAKDLIKSGGEWINPAEIEAVVGALPEVSLAAVIGRPDPKWGERPILLIEMRHGRSLSDEALTASLKGKVASWWIPDRVIRLREMPLAATGKIDKMRLRSEYGKA